MHGVQQVTGFSLFLSLSLSIALSLSPEETATNIYYYIGVQKTIHYAECCTVVSYEKS